MTELAGEIGKAGATLDLMLQSHKQDILLEALMEEAIGTSSIEGERLNREDVMSSLKNHLGLNNPPIRVFDRRAANIANMMIAVRDSFSQPLTIDIIQN